VAARLIAVTSRIVVFRKPNSLDPAAANSKPRATRLLKWRCTCRLANQRLLHNQAAEIIDAVFEKRERRTLQSAGRDQGRLVNGPKNNQLLNCVKSLVKALIPQICLILATL
jgi:hypothetical protein